MHKNAQYARASQKRRRVRALTTQNNAHLAGASARCPAGSVCNTRTVAPLPACLLQHAEYIAVPVKLHDDKRWVKAYAAEAYKVGMVETGEKRHLLAQRILQHVQGRQGSASKHAQFLLEAKIWEQQVTAAQCPALQPLPTPPHPQQAVHARSRGVM